MRYERISGTDDAAVWFDVAGRSGVIVAGDELWPGFQAWAKQNPPNEDTQTLEMARIEATERLHAMVDQVLAPILARYPGTEAMTWPTQLSEAQAWLADPSRSVPTLLLDEIGGPFDEAGKQQFCEAVVSLANDFKIASGRAIAWRRECSDWIAQLDDGAALHAWRPLYPEVPR